MQLTLASLALALLGSAVASPVKRAEAITVTLTSGAASVLSVDHLSFTADVTNVSEEDLKILKYGTILDTELPTRSFAISKDGEAVAFTGVKINVDLTQVDDSAFVTIAAGETVTVTHMDIGALYDFESAGLGAFKITPLANFLVVGAADSVTSIEAVTKAAPVVNSVHVDVTGDVAKRELQVKRAVEAAEPQHVGKRAVVSCSNASQASFISASYSEAKTLATRAASYIATNGANSLYTAYYKTTSTTSVRSRFTAVANENSSSRTLNCSDPYGVCTGGVIAYTVVSTTNIYYCSIFYNEVPISSLCSGTSVASRNVRGGTTLHELTHAVDGTDDITYGCSADQSLSASNQYNNADNYNCFSTQVYQNTGC